MFLRWYGLIYAVIVYSLPHFEMLCKMEVYLHMCFTSRTSMLPITFVNFREIFFPFDTSITDVLKERKQDKVKKKK